MLGNPVKLLIYQRKPTISVGFFGFYATQSLTIVKITLKKPLTVVGANTPLLHQIL